MKIVHISNEKNIKKTPRELQEEKEKYGDDYQKYLVSPYKVVPLKEPIYVVEMSMKELQLVSFYLELENRKPIVNVKLQAELTKVK